MEKLHKERIRVNYRNLTKAIKGGVVDLAKDLFNSGFLSDSMEEDIVYQRTPTAQAYRLLDIIPTRGPNAYKALYEAVCDSKLWEAADLLEPDNAPHEEKGYKPKNEASHESTESVDEPLPDVWPTESHLANVDSLKLKVENVAEYHKVMIERFKNPHKDIYKMNRTCKGRVLIIDNEHFGKNSGFTERTGSSQDTKGLTCIFQALEFDTVVQRDQTKEKMEALLRKECEKNFEDVSCYLLIILSHGVRGKVFGSDGICKKDGTSVTRIENFIKIEDIKRLYSNVDSLKNKPKLFIIQACQSDETPSSDREQMVQESAAARSGDTSQQENSSNVPFIEGIKHKPQSQEATGTAEDYEMEADSGDNIGILAADSGDGDRSATPRAHEGADMFTALATVEGHPSYRNTAFGSWFIQAFIYVVANFSHKHELSTLMRKVTQLVNIARSRTDESQVCESRSTFGKEFYFFPGLSSDGS